MEEKRKMKKRYKKKRKKEGKGKTEKMCNGKIRRKEKSTKAKK